MTQALPHHPAYLIPGDEVDGWRVVERVGTGGFGAVYVVEKEGRRCAMKFSLRRPVSEDPARTDARLFQREVVILVQLSHLPNVVRLHACGRYPDPVEGHFYIVMDYVEGDTLSAWAERHSPTPREVARLFARLAAVLDEAHRSSIFHRDLKPENILVRRRDSEPVLLDFGAGDFSMAKPLTEGPLPPGTPHYRSPESLRFLRQNRNNPEARYAFKASDDLYSLGICLYEALTAKDPFQPGQERPRLNMEIELRVPPAPHELNPRVPAALGDVVRRLMSKSPHERHPTGEALRRELEELATMEDAAWDKPIHPPPVPRESVPVAVVEPSMPPPVPSTPIRRARWSRAAALVGATVLASAVVIPWVRGGASSPQEFPATAPERSPPPTVRT
ncbi:serine/threonine protein kinase, partial [Corallococcus llansteffanensis]